MKYSKPANDWRWQLRHRLTTLEDLEKIVNLTVEEKRAISFSSERLKMAITPYFASLIDRNDPGCPIRRQAIPLPDEFQRSVYELSDPCGEEKHMVVPGLVHRYPDRVLLLITDACAVYCRHCTRRRMVGSSEKTMSNSELEKALNYIKDNPQIRDVLISGGDPFYLSDGKLDMLLNKIRKIPTVEIIRIGTRIPVTLPQRITSELVSILKKYHPLYISIHFNHPKEITPECIRAVNQLADAGIPLGSQTVLLKGINDKPPVMMKLMQELLKIRVRPYYIYQCDLAPGTEHCRTSINTGLKIMEALRGYTSGYAVPTYVIDAPGGGGKVPINPEYLISRSRQGIIIRNYEGKLYIYPDQGYAVARPRESIVVGEIKSDTKHNMVERR